MISRFRRPPFTRKIPAIVLGLFSLFLLWINLFGSVSFSKAFQIIHDGKVLSVKTESMFSSSPDLKSYTLKGDFSFYDLPFGTWRIWPDDCIDELLINKTKVDLSSYSSSALCNWSGGFLVNLSDSVHLGRNDFSVSIRDTVAGQTGLRLAYTVPWYVQNLFLMIASLFLVLSFYLLFPKVFCLESLQLYFPFLIGGLALVSGGVYLVHLIRFELSGVNHNWDSPIYWAIGRGILNGLKPYADLYDYKPPGIFLLSALSMKLTGSEYFTHVFEVIAVVFIAIAIPCFFILKTRKDTPHLEWVSIVLLSVLFGIMLATYTISFSGQFQTEAFGASCGVAFLLAFHTTKTNPMRSILIATTIFLSVGFKEPFLLTLISGSLLLSDSISGWCRRFLLPLLIASVSGLIVLAVIGYLDGYLNIYIHQMLSAHIHRAGPLWERGLRFGRLFNHLTDYSGTFGALFIVLSANIISLSFLMKKSILDALKSSCIVFISFYLGMLAVGLGGEYYNHHHTFLVPFLAALFLKNIILFVRTSHLFSKACLSTVFLLVSFSLLNIKHEDLSRFIADRDTENIPAKRVAKIIDDILDRCKVDRYLYLGHNGIHPFGFTKHSPQGPIFAQFDWLDSDPQLKEMFFRTLYGSQVILFNQYVVGSLKPMVEKYIADHYSQQAWPCVGNLDLNFEFYKLFFRKRETTK